MKAIIDTLRITNAFDKVLYATNDLEHALKDFQYEVRRIDPNAASKLNECIEPISNLMLALNSIKHGSAIDLGEVKL